MGIHFLVERVGRDVGLDDMWIHRIKGNLLLGKQFTVRPNEAGYAAETRTSVPGEADRYDRTHCFAAVYMGRLGIA